MGETLEEMLERLRGACTGETGKRALAIATQHWDTAELLRAQIVWDQISPSDREEMIRQARLARLWAEHAERNVAL